MARGGTPAITVRIVDEVSEKLDRKRREIQQLDRRVTFRQASTEIKAFEGVLSRFNRELMSFIGLTGIGAFMGSGLVGGIAAVARSLKQFSDSSLSLQYLSKEVQLTTQQISRLTSAGKVLGMSQEEARGGVTAMSRALEQLRVEGTGSAIFKQLAQQRGGEELGRSLIRIVRGPDGIYRGMQFLSERTLKMEERSQNFIKNVFNQPSVAWAEMLGLKGLQEVQEPQRKDLIAYNLAWENLNRTWYNTKVTINQALLPAMQSVLNAVGQYVRGPGKEIVEKFAAWLRTISAADINAFVKAVGTGISLFVTGIEKLWPILLKIDAFVRENLGGWTTVLAGVASFAFIVWLGSFGRALAALGPLITVVTAIAAIAALVAPSAAQAAPAPAGGGGGTTPGGGGGGGGGGGTIQLPEVEVEGEAPRQGPRTRSQMRGGPATFNQRFGPFSEAGDIENAAPYRVAGGWQPPPQSAMRQDRETTRDLARAVGKLTDQVDALNDFMSQAAFTSSDVGAGGLAGLATVLRGGGGGVPAGGGAPRGGGAGRPPRGGGGGRRGRGGGGVDRRTAPPTTYQQSAADTKAIAAERAPFIEQLKDPVTRSLAAWAMREEQYDPGLRSDPLEALANRFVADNARRRAEGLPPKTVKEFLTDGFYGPVQAYRRRNGTLPQATEQQLKDFERAEAEVAGGSNRIRGRTDQGMKNEHKADPGGKFPVRGEYYSWHRGGTKYERGTAAARAAPGQDVPAPQQPTATPSQNPPAAPDVRQQPTAPRPGAILPDPVTGITRGQVGDPRGNYPGRRAGPHQGIDIHAPLGTPVVSQAPGVVQRVYTSSTAAGNAVVVKYDDAHGGYEVRYYHLSAFGNFRPGQRVNAGDVVGFVGKTGAGGRPLSSDPHLHYEVFDRNGRRINPNLVLGIPGRTRNVELTTGAGAVKTPSYEEKKKEYEDVFEKAQKEIEQQRAAGKLGGTRARTRFPLTINIRGPRGAKVDSDSTGVVAMKVNREYGATLDRTPGTPD